MKYENRLKRIQKKVNALRPPTPPLNLTYLNREGMVVSEVGGGATVVYLDEQDMRL